MIHNIEWTLTKINTGEFNYYEIIQEEKNLFPLTELL